MVVSCLELTAVGGSIAAGLPWATDQRVRTRSVVRVRRGSKINCSVSARVAQVNEGDHAGAEFGESKKLRVLMVAGGTGGHVYPAIAIADEIRRLYGGMAMVEFAGTRDRLEWSVVPRAGYEIKAIPAVPIRRPFTSFANLLLPTKLVMALFSCWKLLRQLRPHVVVGTGGYVSGSLCLVAAMMGFPVVVQEQNAYSGVTNRLLGKVAKAVFVTFPAAIAYFPQEKCFLYGNPIRIELRQHVSSAVARCFFFSQDWQPREGIAEIENGSPRIEDAQCCTPTTAEKPGEQVVLILGGSLGAEAINRAVAGMAVAMLEENCTRHILWQTGPAYFAEIMAHAGNHPRLAIFPYLNAMHMAYAAADLVVARAGAITCSELLVTGKPSILIPSTNVAEDHQTKNAMAMAQQGTAKVLMESSLNSASLTASINELLGDAQKLMNMTERALKAATPDASSQIAEHVILLAKCSLPTALV